MRFPTSRMLMALCLCATPWGLVHAEPDSQRTCAIEGYVSHKGASTRATVLVQLRSPLPSHWHDVTRRTEHVEAWLREPPGDDAVVARAVSNERGFYRVDGLAPARYRVRVVGDSSLRGGAMVPLEVAGQVQTVDFKLREAPHRLSGRIRLPGDQPFRGYLLAYAKDIYFPHGSVAKPVYERAVRTKADGTFELTELMGGSVVLVLLEPSRRLHRLKSVNLPHGSPLDLLLAPPEHSRPVQIYDVETGAGISGAALSWVDWWPRTQCLVYTSGAEGRAVLPALNATIEDLVVRSARHGTRRLQWLHRGESRVPLRRAARLVGRILSNRGTPLAGIRVHVVYRHWQAHYFVHEPAVTDADGRYVIEGLDWGVVRVFTRGSGWIPTTELVTQFERTVTQPDRFMLEAGHTTVADFTMVPGEVLHGRVVDVTGAPVVGVPVLMRGNDDPLYSWTGREPPPCAATDSKGRFRVAGLLPDAEYDFEIRVPGLAPVKAEVRAGEGAPSLEFRLSGSIAATVAGRAPGGRPVKEGASSQADARWLNVTVVDRDTDAPIPGATIGAMMDERPGSSARHHLEWTTDSEGKARVGPLRPLTGDLNVHANRYVQRNMLSFDVPTREGRQVRVALRRELDITGRVLTPDGKPAGGAVVETQSLEGSNYWGREAAREDGTFVVPRVRGPFRYRLTARWQDEVRDYMIQGEAVGGTSDTVLRLAPVPGSEATRRAERERLRLILRDDRGRPVADADVIVGGIEVRIDSDGVVHFKTDVRSEFPLEIFQARDVDGYALPLGPVRKARLGASTGRQTVVLPNERAIEGVVRDAAGRGVRQVRIQAIPVRAHRSDPPDSTLIHETAWTRHNGSFRLGRLGAEPYVLDLLMPVHVLAPKDEVRATPGTGKLTIKLRATCRGTVRVLDSQGRPVVGAQVAARHEGWEYFWRRGWYRDRLTWSAATTGADGRAVLPHLDPDRVYEIHVEVDDESEDDVLLDDPGLTKWRPTKDEFTVRLPSKDK